ncbi:MAG: hypothetical protein GX572_01620 [Clostridia bacterium]|nr:hypothetical protein [Clostridia bacterium]
MKRAIILIILMAFVLSMLALSACGPSEDPGDQMIIEPGLEDDPSGEDIDSTVEDEPDATVTFADKGEQTTVDDLTAAQAKIKSYYFEQTIPYADASVFLQVWYCDNKMKVITSVGGQGLSEFYYDYDEMSVISYSPGDSDTAIKMDFDPQSLDAPDNPVADDYGNCVLLGNEKINRQLCYILQTPSGDKLWVGTKYGFPLQVEFVDHLGDLYTVQYRNLEINTLSAKDVAVPANLPIYYMGSGASY